MPNTQSDNVDDDFVLKHRIAGAGFLLFIGVLVLPWLLGPPSEASKEPTAVQVQTTVSELPSDIESEILAELKERSAEPEQVYISKIMPPNVSRQNSDAKSNTTVTTNISEPEATEPSALAQIKEAEEQLANKKKQADIEKARLQKAKLENERKAALAKQKEQQALADKKKQEKLAAEKAKDAVVKQSKLTESDRARLAAADLVAALEAETNSLAEQTEPGWIVQVGLFSDKAGAAKVLEGLTSKGFKPATSIVDTNLGVGTGTRIWLGPFTQRADADKAKKQLSEKTGTSGFIRKYP